VKKIAKKRVKPLYTVDITDCENIEEFALAFAIAKHNAGLPLTDRNLLNVCSFVMDMTIAEWNKHPKIIFVCDICKKKKPWYKRFWNWLFGRK